MGVFFEMINFHFLVFFLAVRYVWEGSKILTLGSCLRDSRDWRYYGTPQPWMLVSIVLD